jgi:hypothetical protein
MQVCWQNGIPGARGLWWRVLGKRASDQTQASQKTKHKQQYAKERASTCHVVTFSLGVSSDRSRRTWQGRDPTWIVRRSGSPLRPDAELLFLSRTPVNVQKF